MTGVFAKCGFHSKKCFSVLFWHQSTYIRLNLQHQSAQLALLIIFIPEIMENLIFFSVIDFSPSSTISCFPAAMV